ncbi:MAG TPA: DMT family transporter [Bryobacteraceae bacterium]|nr:DMT family transporter [Bryobacteraceae bacterium]
MSIPAARRAEAALIFNTLIWGSTFVVVKQALRDVSPVLFLALRFTLATAVLLVLFRGTWSRPRNLRRSLAGGAAAGVFLFSGYAFQTIGLQYTTAPKSAFLTGLTAVITPLLAMLVYRKMPQVMEIGGILVATLGMALMTLPGAGAPGETWAINRGDLLTVCCAVCYAAHILVLSRYSATTGLELLATAQIGVAALLAWSLFHWIETPQIRWTAGVWVAIVITGLFATAVAFTFQAWAQRYTSSARTALIFMLEPVFAWITSYLLAGETLSRRAAAGAALILAGILLVELKPFSRREHQSDNGSAGARA